ncbi:DUF6319 family protein [Pseudonocardia oroxyli]|uniref:Uncharacterized protein n=1 Tax=Pseudonocardia oroxyli TaxID=366584 RepID=A0A1G7YH61_PSEOR|nr:hypothetical protein SAMN05216377_11745 [Pseudonocardia oroxyli]
MSGSLFEHEFERHPGAVTAPTPEPADSTPEAPVVEAPTDQTPTDQAPSDAPGEPAPRKRGRPKGSTAKTTRVVELTLTVSGAVDGEWQAELKRGATWLARGLPVSAGAVLKAAAELHPEISGPIDEVIAEARATREAKVAELEAQLEQARKALAELE